jgi:hypothetical protein
MRLASGAAEHHALGQRRVDPELEHEYEQHRGEDRVQQQRRHPERGVVLEERDDGRDGGHAAQQSQQAP